MYMFSSFSLRWIVSRLLMKVLIIIVLLAGASGTRAVHAAGGTAHFSIAPGNIPHSNKIHRRYFAYTSQPGVLVEDSIHVTNVGTVRGSVDLYAVDATTSQVSGVTFFTPDDPRHDVGAWITLSNQKITLNPGQSQDVPFSLRIPSSVRPGQHGGGIIARDAINQAVSSNSGAIHTTVQVQSQEILGVLVNLPGTLVEKLNVTGITYNQKSTSQNLLVGLANTGTQIIHPSGNLQVSDKKGHLLQNVPLKLAAILPQTAISYPVSIQNNALNSGTYTASISLSYEGGHHVSYETTFVASLPQPVTGRSIPKPVTNQSSLRTVSGTTASSSNLFPFNTLTLWHSIPVLLVIMLLCAVLLLWCWRMYKPLTKLRRRSK
jgi:Bacterial protein of unknown function (DUF916)